MIASRNEIKISEYVRTLRRCLPHLPAADRDDIAEEIRVHVLDRLSSDPSLTADDVLARLGTPQALSREYGRAQLLERASRSYSPLLMLRATLRWALTGIQGFLIFDIALIGYAFGVGFLLLALAKPFFPDMIGLWMGPGLFDLGLHPDRSPAHELLGDRFIPLALTLGVLCTLGTTKLLRLIIRRFGQLRLRLATRSAQVAIA